MSANLADGFAVQTRVIGALILRDMRTRFGRSFVGYLVIVGWPLSHLLAITGVYILTQRLAPIGASVPIFVATGVLPYILCLYPSRTMMLALIQNQPLLYFPIVKTTDIVFARGILEMITAFWVTAIFAILLYIAGVDIAPLHYQEAIQAMAAIVYFGFTLGFIGAILCKLVRAWLVVQIVVLIAMYLTAGVFFMPAGMPDEIQNYLWFNPLLHCVEWLRSAYYDGYGYGMLSREYLLGFSTCLLMLGLVIERAVRGELLKP